MFVKRLSIFALALLPLASGAWAADATPEGAKALEQQVRDWITSTLGPQVKIAARPLQVTPEGDHYAINIPFGDAPDAPRITADARSADGARWTIDNVRPPEEFKLNVPVPADKDTGTPAHTVPVTYKLTFGQMATQLLLDPTYGSASSYNSTLQDMNLAAHGENLQQTAHVDRGAGTGVLRPGANGRLDLLTEGSFENYTISTKTKDAENLDIAFGKVRVSSEVDGFSRDRGVQVLQALIQMGSLMQGDAAPAGAAKLDPKQFQALVEAIADLASGMSLNESVDRLSFSYGGLAGSLNALRFGFAAKTDGGLLNARLDLGAEGLTLPELGLGDMVQLIPSSIALRPTVSGVPTAELVRLAEASQNGGSPSPEEIQALFSHGGITAGLDSFSIDVAGTGFSGMGKMVFSSPEAFSGTAQITATNLDLLQQRVAANPQLAQALPVFIVAKGIGRTVNNQMVWDISYQNGRLLVNNQDLSALTGGARTQDAPKAPGRPTQPRPQQRR
ncbi:MAG: hypothetical protein JOZ05_09355 [Acetobacteraceae bacterium]|nr:hypothetical protein [Acetobacteraceae bacterium]